VAIQRVHASKRLLAAIAGVRAQVEVQRLVPFTIVLAGETLLATRPLALEWSLLIVRSQVTYQQTTTLQDRFIAVAMQIYVPFKLKWRVNVLPQPGTGQTNEASPFLRPSLALAVAGVVTCCLSTLAHGFAVGSVESGRLWVTIAGLPDGLGYGEGLTDEPKLACRSWCTLPEPLRPSRAGPTEDGMPTLNGSCERMKGSCDRMGWTYPY